MEKKIQHTKICCMYPQKMKLYIHKNLYTNGHSSFIYDKPVNEKHPCVLSWVNGYTNHGTSIPVIKKKNLIVEQDGGLGSFRPSLPHGNMK